MKQTPIQISRRNRPFKFILTVILFIVLATVKATAQDDDKVYTKVDGMATFPGGMEQLMNYISSNIRYPAIARENNIQGKVFITFVIEKDGSLNDIRILRGIGGGCDEEATRVLKASPKWKPATVNDVVVRSQFTVPISFHLSGPPLQTVFSNENANDVFTAVEHPASFPGGLHEFGNYLAQSIRYPEDARKHGVQGKIFLTFVVEKDGTLSNMKVLRGIGSGCDEEAVRVMAASPKWTPGVQNGHIVRSQFTVPISFTLAKN